MNQNAPIVLAVDLLELAPIPGVSILQADLTNFETQDKILQMLGGNKADVVLSDMAPSFSGDASRDHAIQCDLVLSTLCVARGVLRQGGVMVAKLTQGGDEQDVISAISSEFKKVQISKPPASRGESREMYVVAQGFVNDKK
eukprot:c9740_g1_i4.p1 GENE.c9740_g1_i4~~c9740_g1_i4.p1  ORF type:complete len:142 (+),score=39.91 c9740_g1_i4:358-783(+)